MSAKGTVMTIVRVRRLKPREANECAPGHPAQHSSQGPFPFNIHASYSLHCSWGLLHLKSTCQTAAQS